MQRILIPEQDRLDFISTRWGNTFPLQLEPTIFKMASDLSNDYKGGLWNFYNLIDKRHKEPGFFMAPDDTQLFFVTARNGFFGLLSAEELGICACLYAYSNLAFHIHETDLELSEKYSNNYHILRDFVFEHPSCHTILTVIN